MHTLFRKAAGVIILTCCLCSPQVMPQATACPMCKTANETDDPRPRAYMYSILFMLSMPMMIFSGFGIAFYRLSRQAQRDAMHATDASATEFESDRDSSAASAERQ